MNITYTYEIIAVNLEGRCMEILFKSEGLPDMQIGARLPFDGELIEDVIKRYAPVMYWEELSKPIQTVAVGTSGTITLVDPVKPLGQPITDGTTTL